MLNKLKHKSKDYLLFVFALIMVAMIAKTCTGNVDESKFTLLPTYNYCNIK